MKLEIILGLIFLFILSFTFLPINSDFIQRSIYIFLIIFGFGLVYMAINRNGIGIFSTIVLIILLGSIYGINYYVSLMCDKEDSKLFLYFYLAIGLYFFFNQQKKIGNRFIDKTLGDCTYHKFSLAIIFFTLITSIFYAEAPVFILCSIILYYLLI